jgi:hypothetical protein
MNVESVQNVNLAQLVPYVNPEAAITSQRACDPGTLTLPFSYYRVRQAYLTYIVQKRTVELN